MAFAAQSLYLSVEEYLKTPFRPDVDYVDGYIEERNLGEADHGALQFAIASYFKARAREWNVRMYLDTRFQVSANKFRVPDVTIVSLDQPKEQIIRNTPILCVEVLSPEDTLRKMLVRVQDYYAAGVLHVWIFDPQVRSLFVCAAGGGYMEVHSGLAFAPGTPIAVNIGELFSALDED